MMVSRSAVNLNTDSHFGCQEKASEMQCPKTFNNGTLKAAKPQVALWVCKEEGTKNRRVREWQGTNMNTEKKNERKKINTSNVISATLSYPYLNWTHHISSFFSFYRCTHHVVNYIPWKVMHHKSIQFLTTFSSEILHLALAMCHSNLGYSAAIDSKYKYSLRQFQCTTRLLWLNWAVPASAANAEPKYLITLLDILHWRLISSCIFP